MSECELVNCLERWRNAGDVAARDRVHAELMPSVRRIAARFASRAWGAVDGDDLAAEGAIGLLDALKRFDPARGVKLITFAMRRATGAMLDFLRDTDHLSRQARLLHRKAVADGKTTGDLARVCHLSAFARTNDYGDAREIPFPGPDLTPVELASQRDAAEQIIRRLPAGDMRFVCRLIHIEGLTMKVVGRTIGISESRVSQLHKHAIAILRSTISRPDPEGGYTFKEFFMSKASPESLDKPIGDQLHSAGQPEQLAAPGADGVPVVTIRQLADQQRDKLSTLAKQFGGSLPATVDPQRPMGSLTADEPALERRGRLRRLSRSRHEEGSRGDKPAARVEVPAVAHVGSPVEAAEIQDDAPAPPPPLAGTRHEEDTTLVQLLRAAAARALKRIDSDDESEAFAARIELACIAGDEFEPLPDGGWRRFEPSSQQ